MSCATAVHVTHALPEHDDQSQKTVVEKKGDKKPGAPAFDSTSIPGTVRNVKNDSSVSVKAKPESRVSEEPDAEQTTLDPAKDRKEAKDVAKGDKDDPQEGNGQETLDVALDLLSQSRTYWEKGDIDGALKSLDEAYALILDVNGDPDLSRQKDDLRLMISKLIVQICASRHTVTTGKQSEIPLIMNADVEKEIRSFQTVERGFFLRSYHRSGMFLPEIQKQLKEAGLPKELAWLPLVESGFQINALSRARALGLWQFIPSTGYKFALKRDRWIDERMDVQKSTRAAIAYLNELHNIFGDWMTCLAAYNCGEGKVLRVISKQHINYLDHFWDLYRQLPNETARYVPRFLATLHIIKDPKKYGMDLSENPDRPIPYETVKTDKCMRIQDIAGQLDVSKESLTLLNSELRLQMTPDCEYQFRVPAGKGEKLLATADQIPKWEPPRISSRKSKSGADYVRHRVKRGETLNSIARRYKVSRQEILAFNHLSGKKGLKVGQRIKVPVDDYRPTAKSSKKAAKDRKEIAANNHSEKIVKYRVKRGDTLQSLASRFNTTVDEIKEMNRIKGNKILLNQVIKIKSAMAKAES